MQRYGFIRPSSLGTTAFPSDVSSPGSVLFDINEHSGSHYSSFLHPTGHHHDARSSKSTFEHFVDGSSHDASPKGVKKKPTIRQRVSSFVRRGNHQHHEKGRDGHSVRENGQDDHQHQDTQQGAVSFPTGGDSEDSTSAKSTHHTGERHRVKSVLQRFTPHKPVCSQHSHRGNLLKSAQNSFRRASASSFSSQTRRSPPASPLNPIIDITAGPIPSGGHL